MPAAGSPARPAEPAPAAGCAGGATPAAHQRRQESGGARLMSSTTSHRPWATACGIAHSGVRETILQQQSSPQVGIMAGGLGLRQVDVLHHQSQAPGHARTHVTHAIESPAAAAAAPAWARLILPTCVDWRISLKFTSSTTQPPGPGTTACGDVSTHVSKDLRSTAPAGVSAFFKRDPSPAQEQAPQGEEQSRQTTRRRGEGTHEKTFNKLEISRHQSNGHNESRHYGDRMLLDPQHHLLHTAILEKVQIVLLCVKWNNSTKKVEGKQQYVTIG